MEVMAFTGPRGVGKTTTSYLIREVLNDTKDVFNLSFADYLREWVSVAIDPMVVHWSKDRVLKDKRLGEIGLPGSFFERVANRGYLVPLSTDMTPRDILIAAGTFLRSIDEDIFCKALHARVESIPVKDNTIVIIDDLRFDNEVSWIKAMPYPSLIIHMDRPDIDLPSRDIHDYVSYEYCDLMYQPLTCATPLVDPAAVDEVRLFLGASIGFEGCLEFSGLTEEGL